MSYTEEIYARVVEQNPGEVEFHQAVKEVLDFDKAVEAAIRFAEKDGRTLVIISADHETGALSLGHGDPEKGNMKGAYGSESELRTSRGRRGGSPASYRRKLRSRRCRDPLPDGRYSAHALRSPHYGTHGPGIRFGSEAASSPLREPALMKCGYEGGQDCRCR